MNAELEQYNKSHVCVTWDQGLTHWPTLFISCSMSPPPSPDWSVFKQISDNIISLTVSISLCSISLKVSLFIQNVKYY